MQNFSKAGRDWSKEVEAQRDAELEASRAERRGAFALVGRAVQAIAEQWRRG